MFKEADRPKSALVEATEGIMRPVLISMGDVTGNTVLFAVREYVRLNQYLSRTATTPLGDRGAFVFPAHGAPSGRHDKILVSANLSSPGNHTAPPKNSKVRADGDLLGDEIDLETTARVGKVRFWAVGKFSPSHCKDASKS